jgi:hypothetical protein
MLISEETRSLNQRLLQRAASLSESLRAGRNTVLMVRSFWLRLLDASHSWCSLQHSFYSLYGCFILSILDGQKLLALPPRRGTFLASLSNLRRRRRRRRRGRGGGEGGGGRSDIATTWLARDRHVVALSFSHVLHQTGFERFLLFVLCSSSEF